MSKSAEIRGDVQGNHVDAKKLANKRDVDKAESLRLYREMQLLQNLSFVDDKSPTGFNSVQGGELPPGLAAPNSSEAIAQFTKLENILMPQPPSTPPLGEFAASLPHVTITRQQPFRSELATKLPMFAELLSRLNTDETNLVVKNFAIVSEAAMKEVTTGVSIDTHIAQAKSLDIDGGGVAKSNIFGIDLGDIGGAAQKAIDEAQKAAAELNAKNKGPKAGYVNVAPFLQPDKNAKLVFKVDPKLVGKYVTGDGDSSGGTKGSDGQTGDVGGGSDPSGDNSASSSGNANKVYAIPADLLKQIEDSVARMMQGSPLETMDIDTLVWTVMLECNKDAESEVRAMAKEMEAINLKKRTMRALKQAYRENKTDLERQMREEFNNLKAANKIGPGWTEEDYFKWRQVAIGKPKTGPDGELLTDKDGKIQMEQPQLATLTMLPPYFTKPKNGVDGGGAASGNSTGGKRVAGDVGDDFGLPDEVEAQLREYFKDYVWSSGLKDQLGLDGEFGEAFHDWAEQVVGLNLAEGVEDVAANLNTLKQWAYTQAQNPIDDTTLKSISEDNLQDLEKAADKFAAAQKALDDGIENYLDSDKDVQAAKKAYKDLAESMKEGGSVPYDKAALDAAKAKYETAKENAVYDYLDKHQSQVDKMETAEQALEDCKGKYLSPDDQKAFVDHCKDTGFYSLWASSYRFESGVSDYIGVPAPPKPPPAAGKGKESDLDDYLVGAPFPDPYGIYDYSKNPPVGDDGKALKVPEADDPKLAKLQEATNKASQDMSKEHYADYGMGTGDGMALAINLYFVATGDGSPTPEEIKKFLEETVGLSPNPLDSAANYDKLTKYMEDNKAKFKANDVFDFDKESERLQHLKDGLGKETEDATLKFLQDKGFVAKGPTKEQVEYDKAQKEFLEKQNAASGNSSVQGVPPDMKDGVLTTLNDLENLEKASDDEVQNQSEMGELKMLKLQMLMDRRAKFLEGLSNFMAKSSKTGSAIIENLK